VNNTWRRNRLGAPGINNESSKGLLSMADNKENDVPVVNSESSKLDRWLEIAKKGGILAGIVIGGLLAAVASGGLSLPPTVIGVLNAILAVLAAAGLASPGLKQITPPSQKGPPADP
jgi:hypothetical protein